MNKRITKKEMIDVLVNESVNPNWRGAKASDERTAWKKELMKRKWSDLYTDYIENQECEFERNNQ